MKKKYTSPEFEEYKFRLEAIMGEIHLSQNPDFNEDYNDENDGNLGDWYLIPTQAYRQSLDCLYAHIQKDERNEKKNKRVFFFFFFFLLINAVCCAFQRSYTH